MCLTPIIFDFSSPGYYWYGATFFTFLLVFYFCILRPLLRLPRKRVKMYLFGYRPKTADEKNSAELVDPLEEMTGEVPETDRRQRNQGTKQNKGVNEDGLEDWEDERVMHDKTDLIKFVDVGGMGILKDVSEDEDEKDDHIDEDDNPEKKTQNQKKIIFENSPKVRFDDSEDEDVGSADSGFGDDDPAPSESSGAHSEGNNSNDFVMS